MDSQPHVGLVPAAAVPMAWNQRPGRNEFAPASEGGGPAKGTRAMKRISIEEHFLTRKYLDYMCSKKDYPRVQAIEDKNHRQSFRMLRSANPNDNTIWHPQIIEKFLDLGEGRLREMDEAGIDMQVLSLNNPGVDGFEPSAGIAMARAANDELSQVVARHPGRFAGFAALPCQDPVAAADELERSVKTLGLKGAKLNSHVGGVYLDDKKYWVIFETAQKLGVPLYLHPREPPPDMLKALSPYTALTGSMWGFAVDGSLHSMRLILGGVFDQFPRLKIILGHLGEALPFFLWRMDSRWNRQAAASDAVASKIKKSPAQYVKENFLITTSGMFFQPALICAYFALSADKIMFAVDHPQESMKEAVAFIDNAPICDSEREKITT